MQNEITTKDRFKQASTRYRLMGLNAIPATGDKTPVGTWTEFQNKNITVDEFNERNKNAYGIGIVCGKISGNLEVIDIDLKYDLTGNLYNKLVELIKDQDENLFCKLLIAKSKSGGFHFYYTCDTIDRNLKLALRPATAKELESNPSKNKVLIETRGEGGFIMAAPTPGYDVIQENEIPNITEDERELLLNSCRYFNEIIIEEKKDFIKSTNDKDNVFINTPWEDYNNRGDIVTFLYEHGWKIINENSERVYFTRPGKNKGISADFHKVKRLFKSWSTSTEFDSERALTPTKVLSILKYNGDMSATCKALEKEGYGKRIENFNKISENNLTRIAEWLTKFNIRRNEITRHIELDGKPMQQKELNTLFLKAKTEFPKLTYDYFDRNINSNYTPNYNPIKDFIEANKHIQPEGAIRALFDSIDSDTGLMGSEFYPDYVFKFGLKWYVSIIASIYGEHSPLMFVLCGNKQGTGKTEFLRRLLPKALQKFYAESKLDAGKDDEILMTQKLLVADDEMGGKSKKDEKRLKEILSKQIFTLREPYGRNNVDLIRLAVLCGTTNDNEILSDPTGNRRIIPVNVLSIDHNKYNSVNKTDVFMEAYHLYANGFNWQLTKDEVKELNKNTGYFEQTSPEHDLICQYFQVPDSEDDLRAEFKSATTIKDDIERNGRQKLNLTRLGMELKKLGFGKVSKKIGGQCVRGYYVIDKQKEVAGLLPGSYRP